MSPRSIAIAFSCLIAGAWVGACVDDDVNQQDVRVGVYDIADHAFADWFDIAVPDFADATGVVDATHVTFEYVGVDDVPFLVEYEIVHRE